MFIGDPAEFLEVSFLFFSRDELLRFESILPHNKRANNFFSTMFLSLTDTVLWMEEQGGRTPRVRPPAR